MLSSHTDRAQRAADEARLAQQPLSPGSSWTLQLSGKKHESVDSRYVKKSQMGNWSLALKRLLVGGFRNVRKQSFRSLK